MSGPVLWTWVLVSANALIALSAGIFSLSYRITSSFWEREMQVATYAFQNTEALLTQSAIERRLQ